MVARFANPYSFDTPVMVVRGPSSDVTYYRGRGYGMGDATQQMVTGITSAAGKAALQIMGPAAAGGPIGLAVGGAMLAITLLSGKIAHLITGCGQVCIQDTATVNQAEDLVQQLSQAYWNTTPRTVGFQKWTLQQLDAIFAQVKQTVGLEKSWTERLTRGGGAPWCAANGLAIGVMDVVPRNAANPFGMCGGWYDTVYDPIAHDTNVIPDPPDTSTVGGALSSLASGAITGSSTGDLALIGGVLLIAVIAMVAL